MFFKNTNLRIVFPTCSSVGNGEFYSIQSSQRFFVTNHLLLKKKKNFLISISRVFLFSHNCFTPKKNKLRLVSSSFCSLVNVFLKRDCKNQHKPPQEYSQEITKNEGNWKILFLLSKKKGVNYLIETF